MVRAVESRSHLRTDKRGLHLVRIVVNDAHVIQKISAFFDGSSSGAVRFCGMRSHEPVDRVQVMHVGFDDDFAKRGPGAYLPMPAQEVPHAHAPDRTSSRLRSWSNWLTVVEGRTALPIRARSNAR